MKALSLITMSMVENTQPAESLASYQVVITIEAIRSMIDKAIADGLYKGSDDEEHDSRVSRRKSVG